MQLPRSGAQKGSKDIIKIVQPSFYEATRILFVHNENKNNDFIQVEKLKSHGLFYRYPYYLSGPWMW